MNLILIDPNLLGHIQLLGQYILNLPNLIYTQKTVPVPKGQTQRLFHRLKVGRDSQQARVARIRGIHTTDIIAALRLHSSVCLEDGVPPAPAEPDCADLVCAGCHAQSVDETVDDGFADSLTVLYEPGPKGSGDDGGILGFVDES